MCRRQTRSGKRKAVFSLFFIILISQVFSNDDDGGSGLDEEPTDEDSENIESPQNSSLSTENQQHNHSESENSTLRETLEEMEPENVSNILEHILKQYSVQERPYYRGN